MPLDEIEMMSSEQAEPSWRWICACYLRAFERCRHTRTDSLMPADKRLTGAVRAVFRASGEADRAVMTGTFTGSRTERNQRFTDLCGRVAVKAGLINSFLPLRAEHDNERGIKP